MYIGGVIIKLFFSTSSKINIANKYIEDADYISKELAKYFDLVIGCCMDNGMSIKILENFRDNKRQINLETLEMYNEDKDKFSYVDFSYHDTTFGRSKSIYYKSDIMLILPGGSGTVSEIFGFLEEKRTKKDNKKLIIYNQDNYYLDIIMLINKYIKDNFNDEEIFDYIKFFNDKDDLIRYIKESEVK